LGRLRVSDVVDEIASLRVDNVEDDVGSATRRPSRS